MRPFKYLSLVLFFVLPFLSLGQYVKEDSQSASSLDIGFTFSLANPVEDYASTDGNNSKAGYAQLGTMYALNVNYITSKNIGLTGQLFYSRSRLDNNAYRRELDLFYNDLYLIYEMDISNYWELGFLIGPTLKADLQEDLYVYSNFKVGPTLSYIPSIEYQMVDTFLTQVEVKSNTDLVTGIAWSVGGGVNYQVSNKTFFQIGFSYYNAHFSHDDVGINEEQTGYGLTEYSQDIQKKWVLLNLDLGIVFKL